MAHGAYHHVNSQFIQLAQYATEQTTHLITHIVREMGPERLFFIPFFPYAKTF